MEKLTPQEATNKILRYCAYQERSHQEVKSKLFQYGLPSSEVNEILTFLITEGFLNEERYARAFVGGKFRMKKWGRLKIRKALEQHNLTSACIRLGMREIDEQDYRTALVQILRKKGESEVQHNLFARRNKIARHAIQKGYEPELVWELVKELYPDE